MKNVDGSHIFIQLKWVGDPLKPKFRYSERGTDIVADYELTIGQEFTIIVSGGRYCIGTENDKGKWMTCVANQQFQGKLGSITEKIIARTYIQCFDCNNSGYFSCRMTCIGDICRESSQTAKKMCTPPNTAVYLTHIAGSIKVGVSLGLPRRWIEQGSDIGTVVAKVPGLEARRIEHLASQSMEFKKAIHGVTKINHLGKYDQQTAELELQQAVERIKPILEFHVPRTSGEIVTNPEPISLQSHYSEVDIPEDIQIIELNEGSEFGGKIIAIKGSIVVVENEGYFYAADFRKLRARTFNFMEGKAQMKGNPSLTEWF